MAELLYVYRGMWFLLLLLCAILYLHVLCYGMDNIETTVWDSEFLMVCLWACFILHLHNYRERWLGLKIDRFLFLELCWLFTLEAVESSPALLDSTSTCAFFFWIIYKRASVLWCLLEDFSLSAETVLVLTIISGCSICFLQYEIDNLLVLPSLLRPKQSWVS